MIEELIETPLFRKYAPPVAGVVFVATFLSLASWQLDRAAEKTALLKHFENDGPYASVSDFDSLGEFDRIQVDGEYLLDRQILIDNIVQNGRPGYFVITPFQPNSRQPLLLVYVSEDACDEPCREVLDRLRRTRLLLGNDMNRVSRVFLHGESPPDKVLLDDQHRGLISLSDKRLARLLEERRPKVQDSGGVYLVDPLDKLIMYFSPGIVPGELADDLKRLLVLSRTG